MPMKTIKAPHGATSINIHGEEYKVKDGFLEIPEMLVPIAESHGYGRSAEREDIHRLALSAVPKSTVEDVAAMKRGDLLVYCEENKLDVPSGTNLSKLRELVWKDMKAKQDLVDKVQRS